MSGNHEIKGFALLCDSQGVIKNILRDDFGLANSNPNGKLFINLVDPSARKQSLDFMLEIRQRKISFDHRLDMGINNNTYSIYFIGLQLMDDLLIIGADNHKDAIDFVNHLQQINNEQSNQIRSLLKQQASTVQIKNNESELLFDEITNLNNELVNLQRELTRKNIELARLNELKNRFLGMAAHDLRNPLGIVQNYTEFLIEEIEQDISEEHRSFLHIIYNSAGSMLRMVEDLLDYSKIESGKVELIREDYDIVERCKTQVETYNTLSLKKEIHISFSSSEKSIIINGDQYKIDQVLNNLLGNAIKFSYPKSEISLQVTLSGEYVTLIVADKGKGINAADVEKIFMPFQGTTRGTQGEKGTGLGLSIVKRIVEAHNGQIWLESVPDEGTTFYVKIPVNK